MQAAMPLEFHSAEITFHTAIDARRCRQRYAVRMLGAGHKLSPPRGALLVDGRWLWVFSLSHRNYPKCSAQQLTGEMAK